MSLNGERTCAECGRPASAHGTPFCVQFENLPQEVWKDFCSWDHLTAWVSKGEPDWEAEATQAEPMPWWGRVGCTGALLLVLAILAIGLISLVDLIV